jgi:tagaturonate reductase
MREERRVIASISRALAAQHEWHQVLAVARNREIELVFSNTTEIGIAIEKSDRFDDTPPRSFPAKLARFLVERGRAFGYARDAGVIVIPCELLERNGSRLRELVLTLAQRWQVEPAFGEWIEHAVPFCNTLVDRIVPGKPNDDKRAELEATLGYRDELMIAAEPYRLFAIEADADVRARLHFANADDAIILTDDVTPFRERKVRILNGGHTLLAPMALSVGCRTVLDAVRHETLGRYLRHVLYAEIVPSVDAPSSEAFAGDVLARFANPYLRHALTDITLQQTAKMRVRVIPSIVRCAERTRSVPPSLAFGFAAYLFAIRVALAPSATSILPLAVDDEGERIRERWRNTNDQTDRTLRDVVQDVCADVTLWQTDLAQLTGFADRVTADLLRMARGGVGVALAAHLDEHATPPKSLASLPSAS